MKRIGQRINISFKILTMCLVLTITPVISDNKRPFYIIGHQVNSIEEIEEFLDKGSNVLESDIQFFPNGSVKEMYHGLPCECSRNCFLRENLEDYLKHVRNITDPEKPNSYYKKMLVQFFDMKLKSSNNKTLSGHDMARHVLDFLWSEDGSRKQEVRVLLYFDQVDDSDVVIGFINEFKDRGKTDLLGNIGFDGGSNKLSAIHDTFQELGITKNIWLGDGNINCFNAFQPYTRLKEELLIRDSEDSYINKVYAWTIDLEERMKKSLKLKVDGMITNVPDKLFQILHEPAFAKDFRLGSIDDDPFAYFKGN